MNYNIISSGSKGNATVINDVLVDCGVPFKALKDDYRHIKLVLLTHIHGDHFRPSTVKRLAAERPTLRFGCCKWLVSDLIKCGVDAANIDVYEIGKRYDYGAFAVSPIKLYHDVPNCGYRLYFGRKRAIYATDTRTLDGISAKGYDYYFIEANYEDEEIKQRIDEKRENGEYAYEIRAMREHLSQQAANDWLCENMTAKSRYVYMHRHTED